ncbi:MAG: VCBS repeat-containing protein [Polyangiaceae bacterium]|nr:VCBS repeat-containing protein [Polyangiaceae bacterium]
MKRPFALPHLPPLPFSALSALALTITACGATPVTNNTGGGGSAGTTSTGGSGGEGTAGGFGGFGTGGSVGTGGVAKACKVLDDDSQNAPTCEEKAPADSFAPTVQWQWTAPPADPSAFLTGSFSTPLVGNFTDDNGDGEIDLCDIPDVLVTAIYSFDFGGLLVSSNGYIHMLSGDTGIEKLKFPVLVDAFVYPAFADIDGDALPEVVTADSTGRLMAFGHDGSVKWTSPVVGGYRTTFASAQCTAIAIYDLNADGTPEILFGWEVYDNKGNKLFGDPTNAAEWDTQYWCVTPTAADLDGDGKLEVIMGHEAYRADGTLYYKLQNFKPAHPQVANLDGDPQPEIFLTNADGISFLDHTGALLFGPIRPTNPNPSPNCWGKPAVVHDFDGDSIADIAAATCSDYTVYQVAPNTVTPKWSNNVQDISGLATATAFDFLGDGVAEAIYADETQIYVFDGKTGATNLTAARQSGTLIEYPVVADCDNDGSAEILYVSNYAQGASGPTMTVLRDAEERWIPARRIWNQYSYHVTNVREDAIIPKVMKKNWLLLNTFRTNSQISANGVDCNPEEPPK